MRTARPLNSQLGAATLFTAVSLLFLVSIVAIYTARNASISNQISADNYRTTQATAAANAAMEQALAYYSAAGFDHNGDGVVDFAKDSDVVYLADSASCDSTNEDDFALSLNYADPQSGKTQATYARYYFDADSSSGENYCMGTSSTSTVRGMIAAYGWSDDRSAFRRIRVCVTDVDVFAGGAGPKQPFVTRVGVGVFGNASIINRYNNSTIWAGGPDAVHGAAYATYLRPSNTEVADFTRNELQSNDETANAVKVSSRNSGNGFDVITNDATLASRTTDVSDLVDKSKNQFFNMFFAPSKSEMKRLAGDQGQLTVDPVGKTGVIWYEGDLTLSGTGTVGAADTPVVLIVNGDMDMTGYDIYGVVYVIGELKVTGNPNVYGSIISENGPNTGAGTPRIVYVPWGDSANSGGDLFVGGAAVAGSWRDW